ncbi:DUF397 domain-containing protein [Actinomadura sp. 1N219]|uniref:DUF397 domain-containing protein n=1 Tax=Actinomadura sp. 1N219 TaxID=3375152 RepID=UPI0037A405A5
MTTWRRSSYSGAGGTDNCVELARLPTGIGVRDSKAPETGRLSLPPEAFTALVARLKRGELPL